MTLYFSASADDGKGAFFDNEINPPSQIPNDSVSISADRHAALMLGQGDGMSIRPGTDGYPELQRSEPTAAEVAAMVTSQRDSLLRLAALRVEPLSDAVDLGLATDDEKASLTAWKRYRVDLARINAQPGFPYNVTFPTAPN